jgi:secreted PhoX family phosphatase
MDATRARPVSARPAGRGGEPFAAVVRRRLSRRGLLKAGLVLSAATVAGPALGLAARPAAAQEGLGAAPRFTPIRPDTADRIVVPDGYRVQVLLSWGDPLFPDVPPFDLARQTAALQERRFGFNCDFLAFLPLWRGNPNEGLLWINHEYTDGALMFPAYDASNPTREQVDIELAAHGASVVRLRRAPDGRWLYDRTSPFNRRITATTPMRLSGPAAGDPLLQTAADPTGTQVLGMLNNCAGGVTPWGTVLTCEENFHQYFAHNQRLPASDPRRARHARYGVPAEASERKWERFYERFDVSQHPNEPFRFGWVVEVDPYDPTFAPLKRTALGRFKHEAATTVLARDGRAVVYSGDDERFEYIYKFVSQAPFDRRNRAANLRLLDAGTLYVARFKADGTGEWLPLVHGQSPLTPAHGFASQADVLIRAREAADAVGATRMDRPEDIEVHPRTGKVYMVMTNNTQRGAAGQPGPDPANPQPANRFGHILEVTEDGDDPAATTFHWELFLLCGADPSTYFAGFPKDQVSAIANPDNLVFDRQGNLWIATDGQPGSLQVNDGVFAVATAGRERGQVKQFLSAVPGAEVASLVFDPNDQTLFVSIQHPGEGSSLAAPTSTWPGPVARPSVIAVTRRGGGPIGG